MAVNDILRIAVRGLMEGQQCWITHHLKILQVGTTGADTGNAITAWNNNVFDSITFPQAIQDFQNQNFVWDRVQCMRVAPTIGGLNELVVNVPGSDPVDALPSTNAVVISRYSGLPGRAGRGRFYMPALPQDSCAGSRITAGVLGAMQAMMVRFIGLWTIIDPPVNWVFENCSFSRTRFLAGLTPYTGPIVNVIVREIIGTQRRRRIGSGV